MSFVIIDNTKDLANAEMTPLLIDYFNRKKYKVTVISEGDEIDDNEVGKIHGIILSGGPILLSEKTDIFRYSKNFTALIEYPEIPILGICFGFQVMGVAYGGVVKGLYNRKRDRVMETIKIENNESSILFQNMRSSLDVFQAHNDHLIKCPKNFIITSRNSDGIIESIECKERLCFGVQFHPENSEDGYHLLDNFTCFCLEMNENHK